MKSTGALLFGMLLLPWIGAADWTASAFANRDDVLRRDGGVLAAEAAKPGLYCSIRIPHRFPWHSGLVLAFEYRTPSEPERKPDYVGVNLIDGAGKTFFASFPASAEWRRAEVRFEFLRNTEDVPADSNTVFREIALYARARNGAPKSMKFEVRNLTLAQEDDPAAGARISYSALPMFNWRGREKRLEYSQNHRFPAEGTFRAEPGANFHIPAEALAAGVWYWRAVDPASGRIADAGKLLIPEDATDFRLPEYEFKTLVAKPHPRLIALANFRLPEGISAETVHELKALQLPPPPEPFRPGADPAIKNWIDWYRKVADGVTAAAGKKMAELGCGAIVSGNPELREHAKNLALEVARNWNPKRGSHISHGDLQAGFLLEGLGWCYDASAEIMIPEERAEVQNALLERGRQFYGRLNPFTADEAQNHPWNQATVLAFTALAGAEAAPAEMREWFDYAAALFAYRFLPALGTDGGNNEGLQYWSYGGGILTRGADFLRLCAGIDLYENGYLRNTARFPLYCAPPDGFHISFSNATQNGLSNHGNFGRVDPAFTARLAAAAGDGYALWYGGVARAGAVTARVPADLAQSKLFSRIGWAVFNTFLPDARENVAVGMHSGKYFAGHQHADQNTFTINAYGDKLAVDGGYYDWYGSEHFYKYSIQTAAHNTILADGEGQPALTPGADGAITAFFDSTGFGYVEGDASKPEVYRGKLKMFRRRMLFLKPGYVVIHDDVAGNGPGKFSWLIHAHGDRVPATGGNQFRIERPRAVLDGRVFLPRDAKLAVAESYTVAPMKPFSSEPLPVSQIDREWTVSAANPESRERVEFLTGMAISPAGGETIPAAELLENETASGLRSASFFAAFSRAGNGIRLDGLESDGRCAAVRFDADGRVADALVIDGATLRYRGETLISEPVPGNYALRNISTSPGDAELKLNGVKLEAETFAVPQGDGSSRHLVSAVLTPAEPMALKAAADVSLLCRAVRGNVSLNFEPGNEPVLLDAGEWIFTAVGREPVGTLRLTGAPFRIFEAEMMPHSFEPADVAARLEAESPQPGTAVGGRIVEKTAASAGRAVCDWGIRGNERAEWKFTVPQDGRYTLYCRVAGVYDRVRREIYCDGAPLLESHPAVRWNATGGWCNGSDDWRWVRLPTLFLSGGEHTLSMKYQAGLSNLDCMVWVREPNNGVVKK